MLLKFLEDLGEKEKRTIKEEAEVKNAAQELPETFKREKLVLD